MTEKYDGGPESDHVNVRLVRRPRNDLARCLLSPPRMLVTTASAVLSSGSEIIFAYITSWIGIVGLLIGRLCRRKVVFWHCASIMDFYGLIQSRLFRELANDLLLVLTMRFFDRVITGNSFTARIYSTRYRVERSRITIIPNFVDTQVFKPSADGKISSSFIYVGRMTEDKGITCLIHAFRHVVDTNPEAKLYMVGSVRADMRGSMRDKGIRRYLEMVKALGLENRVIFLGPIPNRSLPKYIAECSALILPSQANEGFGKVLLEAMAMKKPVIATSYGPLPTIVDDGITGLIVPPGDPKGLAEAITKVLRDHQLARRLGNEAFNKVHARFTLDLIALQYVDEFKRIARQP